MKNALIIIGIISVLAGFGLGVWLGPQLYSKKDTGISESQLEQLKYYELVAKGTKALFARNYEDAVAFFESADQIKHEELDWTENLDTYLEQKMEVKDSLQFLGKRIEQEYFMTAAMESQLTNLDSAVVSKDEQIRIYKEVLENLRSELRGLFYVKEDYQDRLDAMDQELIALKKRGFGVEFKNESNIKIIYFGDLENGMAHGEGFGIYETGGIYQGEWKENKRHGQGTYKYKDGHRYIGEFINDMREGYGEYFTENGEHYKGFWKNNLREGEGTFYDKNGKIMVSGLWKEDKIVDKK